MRRQAEPSTYARATWLFLRVLGVVYLAAFWSLHVQILGLVGHDGILPADQFLADARSVGALERFWTFPSLAWIGAGDAALQAMCLAGVALSVLLVAGLLSWLVLPVLWALYLSLSVVCGEFLFYQWDALLLESGLLATFLAPWSAREHLHPLSEPPRLAVRLMLWLLFRLMVGSGVVKLASGDPTWHGLTAMTFHFETQPLPTPIAWYAHHLPTVLLNGITLSTLVIEIGAPFLMLAPRRFRVAAFLLLVGLQLLIAATGNYAFFNLLSAGLCLFLLDDVALSRFGTRLHSPVTNPLRRGVVIVAAMVTLPVSAFAFGRSIGLELRGAGIIIPLARVLSPLRSINTYGLFANMTTTRPEIVVEGSEDGETWLEYEFKYKPGGLRRAPPWVAPHQPRLDWQMWFAALGQFESEPWFQRFCYRLLEGDRKVLGLMEQDPFAGRKPQFIRAIFYRYHFSDSAAGNDVWWTRERLGDYSPTLSLNPKRDAN